MPHSPVSPCPAARGRPPAAEPAGPHQPEHPAQPHPRGLLRALLLSLRALPLLLNPRRAAAAGRDRDRAPWRSLRYPSMRWWSAANLVSNTGTWMQLTVQNLLVLQVTGSAGTTGLSVAVQAAPGLLLGVAGGNVVDSWPRKLTASVSQAVLGVVAFATAALIALDLLNAPVLMVLAAVTGLIATVDGPACSLLGNDLVRPKDVPSAIALGSMVHNVGRLVGTALAGGAVAWFGTASAYAVNGLSFLAVAAIIPFLRPVDGRGAGKRRAAAARGKRGAHGSGEAPRGDREEAPRRDGAREGLVFFLRRPRLVALAGITGISAIFGRNYGLTLAVLVTGPLAAGQEAFGTVATVLAVGGIVGSVLAGRLSKPSVGLVAAMAAAGGLLQAVAGLSPTLLVLLLLTAPMAVVESVSDTAGTTVLQTDPPAEMRGRVLGVWRTASTGWGLAGPPLLGVLMEVAGARGTLSAGGLLVAGAIGAGALYHHGRRGGRVPLLPVRRGAARRLPELGSAA